MKFQTSKIFTISFFLLLSIFFEGSSLRADTDSTQSRAEFLRKKRKAKLANIQPQLPEKTEQAFLYIQKNHVLQKIFRIQPVWGFKPKFGLESESRYVFASETGSGFALGLEYENRDILPGVDLFGSAALSTKLYRNADGRATFPDMLGIEGFYSIVYARYRNYTQQDFYGIGSDSLQENRTNYRSENFEINYTIGKKWFWALDAYLTSGYMRTRIASGESDDVPSIEEIFDEETAPGLYEEPHLFYIRPGIVLDSLDEKGYPRSGSKMIFEATFYKDVTLNRFSFNTYFMEFQQFIPFLHKNRVIALRGKIYLTDVDKADGQQVPFYMLPYLGGHNTLRGYREFRFFDENFLLFNAEYRWKAWTGLDMALFADFGNVYSRIEDITLHGLKTSFGFGFRFTTGHSVFMRLDVAWHEWGTPRYFLKLYKVF